MKRSRPTTTSSKPDSLACSNKFIGYFDTFDRQIDNLVYELYELTTAEIAIVENS